jgi:hypothetical protein
MIFETKKKIFVWCDDPQEDPVISVCAGCLANHDHAHSLLSFVRRVCVCVNVNLKLPVLPVNTHIRLFCRLTRVDVCAHNPMSMSY